MDTVETNQIFSDKIFSYGNVFRFINGLVANWTVRE